MKKLIMAFAGLAGRVTGIVKFRITPGGRNRKIRDNYDFSRSDTWFL